MKKDRNFIPAPGMMVPYPMMGPTSYMGASPIMMSPNMSSNYGCGGNNNDNNSNELNRLRQQVNNLERRVSILENNQATPYNNYSDSNVQII